ncbi:MAG: peptidylprolyl isomerase [Candidatus Rokubacteria bacterium]|nr:peptidylprolyl isomerase [Candidatus Rokubacteria bacterium]
MRARAALLAVLVALALAGCAMPSWMPFGGKKPVAGPAPRPPEPPTDRLPDRVRSAPADDDAIADRIVAVVNNDAITLGELQESIAAWRRENRQRSGPTDSELASQFLNRLIDARLQLQEADREKITVDDAEVTEELADFVKKVGVPDMAALEASLKAEGVTMESLRKRLRERLRMGRLIRRKVALRVSVTEAEIDKYVEANRPKLETGLSYHARHILIAPDGTSEAAWDTARSKADGVRADALAGVDFADLARRHSADASAKDGGDLGTLKRGELAQDIESQIVGLAVGEISEPYRSPLGWHVFKLESKESLEGEGLVRVRQQIRDILFREKYDARLDTWLREIKQRAIIEVRM